MRHCEAQTRKEIVDKALALALDGMIGNAPWRKELNICTGGVPHPGTLLAKRKSGRRFVSRRAKRMPPPPIRLT